MLHHYGIIGLLFPTVSCRCACAGLLFIVLTPIVTVAKERCLINTGDDSRMLAMCLDYCCGNLTFQYCCTDCSASIKSSGICSQNAVISGLVLLVVGVLFILLLVAICTQFGAISDWTEQHIFTIQRSRVGMQQQPNETHSAQIGSQNFPDHTYPVTLIPSFLLPKLPNYSECVREEPPPPFDANGPTGTPGQQQQQQQPQPNASEQSASSTEPSRHYVEHYPDTPPPNYSSVTQGP